MLAAGQRLRRRDEFAAAIRAWAPGRSRCRRGPPRQAGDDAGPEPARSPGSTIRRARVAGQSKRAGFVVPRAVGSAVVRNRVRRRLRHLVRDRLASLPAGSLLVVRALPGAADRPYQQLAADLDAASAACRGTNGGGRRGRTRAGTDASGPGDTRAENHDAAT